MRYFKVFLIVLAVFLAVFSPFLTTTVSANWYSYFQQGYFYGIRADIYTPTFKPYMPGGDHQSNSVTTLGGGPWVQAGWLLYPEWNQPRQYIEYWDSEGRQTVYLTNQPFGTGVKYEVSYNGQLGPETWCIWISGIKKDCWPDIRTAPTSLIAQSETHTTTDTVFWTDFTAIRLRNSSGIWVYPTLINNMKAEPPYGNSVKTSDNFKTWRHGLFLSFLVYD